MIIEGLLTLVFNLLMSLLSFIDLPDLSDELKNQVYKPSIIIQQPPRLYQINNHIYSLHN